MTSPKMLRLEEAILFFTPNVWYHDKWAVFFLEPTNLPETKQFHLKHQCWMSKFPF